MTVRVVVPLWAASVLSVGLLARGDATAYSRVLALTRGLGLVSLGFLSLALCVTPLARGLQLLGRGLPGVSRWRRALGLAALGGAALHAVCAVAQSPLSLAQQYADAGLCWGLGALLVLCALGVTSSGALLRRLRMTTWKELHRLAYAAFGCGVLHALLMPFAWTLPLLGGAACVLGLGLLRLVPTSTRGRAADP